MNDTDRIRARLDQLAAAEAANPSPVWAPVLPDDEPEHCPQCGNTVFDFDPNFCDGISMGPAWLCTECQWGQFSASTRPPRLQATGDDRPDEATPGTDY